MFDGLRESLGQFRSDVEESQDTTSAGDDDANDPTGDTSSDQSQRQAPPANRADADDTSAEPPEEGSPGITDRAKSMARGRVYIDADDLEDPLWDLEMALVENDVAVSVAETLTDRIRDELIDEQRAITTSTGSLVTDALREALLSVLLVDGIAFMDRLDTIATEDPPAVVVFTGVNGVGKTTTIAKVAHRLEDTGRSVVLANGDTYRAGANEQIEEHADRLDIPIISHERGGDPAAVIYDAVEFAAANDVDVVLGDTAGRLHTSDDLMAQLEKIDRVVGPDLTVFVDEAVAGQDAVERAREFDAAAAIDGAILTKADADTAGGAAISIAHVTGKPVLFLGTGQGYDDLQPFDPAEVVDQLLGDA